MKSKKKSPPVYLTVDLCEEVKKKSVQYILMSSGNFQNDVFWAKIDLKLFIREYSE